jgi:hypothetical protein
MRKDGEKIPDHLADALVEVAVHGAPPGIAFIISCVTSQLTDYTLGEVETIVKRPAGGGGTLFRNRSRVTPRYFFDRVFAALKPASFERCFTRWIRSLVKASKGRLIAVDGKTLRRSFDQAASRSAIHMVSAFASANHLVFGQIKTAAKDLSRLRRIALNILQREITEKRSIRRPEKVTSTFFRLRPPPCGGKAAPEKRVNADMWAISGYFAIGLARDLE